jgi:hypothetical protein
MLKLVFGLSLVLALLGCTTVNTRDITLEQAALADIATTAYALEHGARELNPLGFWGSSLLKGYYVYYLREDLERDQRSELDRFARSLWAGAAVNNAVTVLVPGLFSIWLGTLTFFLLYD